MPDKIPEESPQLNMMVDHLFRHESGKMVSVLSKIFGLDNIELAEDIVQDTFLTALHTWRYNRIPENPPAWLYKTAKNKTIDVLRRNKNIREKANELNILLKSEWTFGISLNNYFHDNEIQDSQLRMIFASCHPSLPEESRLAFTLKILCGFSNKEIARSLVTTEQNVNKRLTRAKQKIRNIEFEIPAGRELDERLESVYKVIYLLFNEGYQSTNSETVIRKDICVEAIRLCKILSEHPKGNKPKTFALLALMYFHAARFDARIDDKGCIILLKEQDRNLWDKELISCGFHSLGKSSQGTEISEYHLEAGIAATHCTANSFEETDWKTVYQLYEMLVQLKPTPITQLNRYIAKSQLFGAENAIEEVKRLQGLESYYLYYTTLAEMYNQLNQSNEARKHLEKAKTLTDSKYEKQLIEKKIENLMAS